MAHGDTADHRHNRNSLPDECGKRIYVEVVSANSKVQKQQVISYTPHEKEIKYKQVQDRNEPKTYS